MILLAKSKTASYILTLLLKINEQQEAILHKRIELGRKIYNACLGLALKRYKVMTESKKYRKVKRELYSINKKFHSVNNSKIKKELDKARKLLYKQLEDIHKEYDLTNYSLINSITPIYKPFNKNIDNKTAQAIGDRVWSAISKLLAGEADKVYFKKYGEFNSLQGKWNKSGIKYNKETNSIEWNKMSIPTIVKQNDIYAHLALNDNVKFVRIIRKMIRGKYKFLCSIDYGRNSSKEI